MQPYSAKSRTLQQVFDDFFPKTADVKSVPLPSARFLPYRRSGDETALRALVSSGTPTSDAYRKLADYLVTDGAFNVNSTSVAAWKVILGSLRGHDTARWDRSSNKLTLDPASTGSTPVNSLGVANGPLSVPTANQQDPNQWTGFRALSDDQIGKLATALVDEIRLRGPFLSLSDFVNRRPGTDTELARQGALQAALEHAGINSVLDSARSLGSIAGASFPDAGKGSLAAGIPGYISQADLLTPLGSTLQPRSDSFTIRAYGNATDPTGKILARAWCEATIQRVPEYIDPADDPDVQDLSLASATNRTFGRKFNILSFRWLSSAEI